MLTFYVHERAELNLAGIMVLAVYICSAKDEVEEGCIIDLLNLLPCPVVAGGRGCHRHRSMGRECAAQGRGRCSQDRAEHIKVNQEILVNILHRLLFLRFEGERRMSNSAKL